MREPCERLAERLPALLDGAGAVSASELSHVEHCLRCQAELARYRRLARLLAQLRHERAELPPGLVSDVLSSLERVARRGAVRSVTLTHRRVTALVGALAGGIALAGIALAGIALARRRPAAGRRRESAARL